MLNILPCPLLATRVKGGSSDHQIVVIPTGTRCYNFDTVLQGKVGTIYDHPTTQYEQFIERYYGRHKGSGKSKACNGDLRRTIILQRCDVWGGGGGGGGGGVQLNVTITLFWVWRRPLSCISLSTRLRSSCLSRMSSPKHNCYLLYNRCARSGCQSWLSSSFKFTLRIYI